MSQETEDQDIYVMHEEYGQGAIISLDEENDTVEVQFEHGVEELSLDDVVLESTDEEDEEEFDFDFDEDEEEELPQDLEEGRGKKGQARQAHRDDEDEWDYEKKGRKANKGRFYNDRERKQSRFDESATLVDLALEKKPVEFSDELNNILLSRLADRIEDLKATTAQSYYNRGGEEIDD